MIFGSFVQTLDIFGLAKRSKPGHVAIQFPEQAVISSVDPKNQSCLLFVCVFSMFSKQM